MTDAIVILAGFLLLIAGGELLVRGSVKVATIAGMSPLLIGITLVGFGTSMPELVTSVQASLAGSPGIAIGNVVGSNIANILLILGLTAALAPIAVSSAAFQRDGVLVVVTAIVFNFVGLYLPLDRTVGAALLVMLIAYLWLAYRQERFAPSEGHMAPIEKAQAFEGIEPEELIPSGDAAVAASAREGIVILLLMALGGLGLVVAGGKLLVDGATSLARDIGVSETVIGLTIVAIGTSLPELVTSAVAAYRKHADVALGNIMGSCIYNVLGIAGATGLIAPTIIPAEVVRFDSLVMLAASFAMLVFARTGFRLNRLEGAVLLASYFVYLWVLWPK